MPEPTVNWVLLGEPSSGRRTLAKHLTLLYTHQNKIDLKKANKRMGPQIQAMIIQQLQILARVAELELQYEFGDKEFGSTYDIRLDLDELQAMRMDDPWTTDDANRITRLWASAGMQGSFLDRGVVNTSDEVKLGLARPLDESLAYFCHPTKMKELMNPNWSPTFLDYLHFPQQHNLQGLKDTRLIAGMDDHKTHIRLTTLLNTPTQKWLSTIEHSSLLIFCVAFPTLPLSVKGNKMNSCDFQRLKTARSMFSSIINSPILKCTPVALMFTKADICALETPEEIQALIHSFMVLNKRQMSIRVLLSDGFKERRVRSVFIGLVKATIALGLESSELLRNGH